MIMDRMVNPDITISGPVMAIAHPLLALMASNPYKIYPPVSFIVTCGDSSRF